MKRAIESEHERPIAKSPRNMNETISLTETEEKLFTLLEQVAQECGKQVTLRVAGGWVRDKLLGRHSDDVDIVLDTMSGKAFADAVNQFEQRHGYDQHAVGVIKANPDQSKHLETATMKLGNGLGWVDFVNLRSETYSDEHRIPEITFGTPLQDAERRDFTMNSLFYNIAEKKIEDFTGKGRDDLAHGLMRTPLEPRTTFLDDPLRVLRAVRFAARFDFTLVDELQEAAKLDEVKDALGRKVSRERVGKEVLGMVTGTSAHPVEAMKLLTDLQLCSTIFLPPQELSVFHESAPKVAVNLQEEMWTKGQLASRKMHALIIERDGGDVDVNALEEDALQEWKLRMLSAYLLPLRGYYITEKKKNVHLPYVAIRDALKLKTKDAEQVGNVILGHVLDLASLIKDTASYSRVKVGLMIRSIGSLWPLVRDVAMTDELVQCSNPEDHAAISSRYEAFTRFASESKLDDVWNLRPLLNGKEVTSELKVERGPPIKAMLDRIIEWQLAHPDGTKDECIAYFQSQT